MGQHGRGRNKGKIRHGSKKSDRRKGEGKGGGG
jgi:hypothetical protein